MPRSLKALQALPGVGRKTASVLLCQAWPEGTAPVDDPADAFAFPVDTHIHRLAQRWGLAPRGGDVGVTESALRSAFAPVAADESDGFEPGGGGRGSGGGWGSVHLRMIFFGREHCPARGHDETVCPICRWAAVGDSASSPVKAGG